jgi:hypothetical protein
VAVSGTGTVTSASTTACSSTTCQTNLPQGSTVTLQAAPATG